MRYSSETRGPAADAAGCPDCGAERLACRDGRRVELVCVDCTRFVLTEPPPPDVRALLVEHQHGLRYFARRAARRCRIADDLVDDVAQETACRALRMADGFDPARGGFLTWLNWQSRAAALKVANARLRAGRASDLAGRFDPPDHRSGRAREEVDRRALALVLRALEMLRPKQRAAVEAWYFGGERPTEAVRADGRSRQCMSARRQTGVQRLRRLYRNLGGQD